MVEIVGGLATVVALGLSIYNFVTGHLSGRRASLSARLEEFRPAVEVRRAALVAEFERIVVTNHGPADASNVAILLGEKEHPFDDRALAVPVLHAGQEHYVNLSGRSWGQLPPASVDLEWDDHRKGRQRLTVWLTVRYLV